MAEISNAVSDALDEVDRLRRINALLLKSCREMVAYHDDGSGSAIRIYREARAAIREAISEE